MNIMDKEKMIAKFKSYIVNELNYTLTTFKGYKTCINSYLDWLTANSIEAKKVSLNQTYDFLSYRRLKGDTSKNIAIYKTAITHFNQAIEMKSNPALLVHLAKNERKTPTQLLDEEFLETIYRDTSASTMVQKRDRCILGMMLFLGLQRNELGILNLEDLKLEEARIYVSQTLTTNERYINLNPKQMMHLSQYFYDIRPKLASEYGVETNRLFFSCGDATGLDAVLSRMMKRLKREFHYVKDFKQFKQSRMSIWIKELGLRQAQYLGGYRYVTSVQRYDFKSIDDLKLKLEYNHPMEKFGCN
jgi:site-specific recombinase XerD